MNKIGMHSAYWRGTGLEGAYDMARLAKRTGADGYELSPRLFIDMTREERRELRRFVEDLGLCFSVNGGLEKDFDIASADADAARRGIEYHKRLIPLIAELGDGIVWSGINYSYWPCRPDHEITKKERDEYLERSANGLRETVKTAEEYGVIYAFEVVNRFEHFALNTAADGIRLCEMVDSKNAKILLDTFHMNIDEDSITGALRSAGEKGLLGHVHVVEANRRVPNAELTHMDWDGIFRTLGDIGYRGMLTLEPFVRSDCGRSATRACIWRDLVSDKSTDALVRDAADGVSFIRGLAEKYIGE